MSANVADVVTVHHATLRFASGKVVIDGSSRCRGGILGQCFPGLWPTTDRQRSAVVARVGCLASKSDQQRTLRCSRQEEHWPPPATVRCLTEHPSRPLRVRCWWVPVAKEPHIADPLRTRWLPNNDRRDSCQDRLNDRAIRGKLADAEPLRGRSPACRSAFGVGAP